MDEVSEARAALEEANNSGTLIDSIKSFSKGTHGFELSSILSELHNGARISLVSNRNITAIERLTNPDFFLIQRTIHKAIPQLKCSYQDISCLVKALVDKAGSDMMPTYLVDWCANNPDEARKLISRATSPDEYYLHFCEFAIQGIADMELTFDLSGHSDAVVRALALRALGRLNLAEHSCIERVVDRCHDVLCDETEIDVWLSAMETAFKVWGMEVSSNPYRQQEFLNTILKEPDKVNSLNLSIMLNRCNKGLSAKSITIILDALARETSDAELVLHNLDNALYSIDDRWDFTQVMNVFASHIPDLKSEPTSETFYNYCRWIWAEKTNLSALYSGWLSTGEFKLCLFLSEISKEGEVTRKIVEISRSDLPDDETDQIFMARKCVGFLFIKEVAAASILLSIVKNGNKAARKVAEDLLFYPLLLSYGGKLLDYLKTQRTNRSKRIRNCVEALLSKHSAYVSGLEKSENLVELMPSIEQRRAFAIKDREFNRQVQQQVYEKSLFAQIATRKQMLYGKKNLVMLHGRDGEVTPTVQPMGEVSYETEIPRLIVVDPVGIDQMIRIFKFESKTAQ